jgi:hypothetical protein
MNRDDVMALANQTAGQNWMDEAHIQRFAALVAAAEREDILDTVNELMGSERERHPMFSEGHSYALESLQTFIRARSNP